jgi:hypothetical protein
LKFSGRVVMASPTRFRMSGLTLHGCKYSSIRPNYSKCLFPFSEETSLKMWAGNIEIDKP